ncbi:peroxidase family protein [Dankookia sp. GCM10030260]|uniref:peroxidase family protein n=1 Tax=Dankookia sp. GCM10030260 TaxID=3273390 RepID=UPI003617A4B5
MKQIRLAEANAGGTPLSDLIEDPTLPFGLRTVTGIDNNLLLGQEGYGSSDLLFRRLLTPSFGDAGTLDLDGPGGMPATATSYAQTSGLVADPEPRIISNLIVDQSATNPAAVTVSGLTGGGSLSIPNAEPGDPDAAPFNTWFTLFGQFFDHGLDLVEKGGSGTIFITLQPDDPLYDPYGADGIAHNGDETNFMVLTRATNQPGADGILGTADDVREHLNKTTPFVDQNQTYTSHPSHQVFLREYVLDTAGRPVTTGRLLGGADGGLATWGGVKAQAREILGIELTDADVLDLPLLATDAYGNFLRGAHGFPQIVTRTGLLEGSAAAPISTAAALRTGHAFLEDIARNADPIGRTADPDDVIGLASAAGEGSDAVTGGGVVSGATDAGNGVYDNELLDAHYVAGDGRANENIGLTAVHHVFHSEHNRLIEQVKQTVLATGDAAFIAEWQVAPGEWNGERLFQAAKFGTEMQYQHLVFEEFARRIQPNIDAFEAYDVTIDPTIVAEFAHVVYRFGHSMLTETLPRTAADGTTDELGLIEAFLNPVAYNDGGTLTPDEAAAAIIRGTTGQAGNEIDEFVTGALRNNLLGLPLDLAAINMARARETGVPGLNEARRQFHDATDGDAALKPYDNWLQFGDNLKHPASLVNFIAAYGTHPDILGAATLAAKRAAATDIVLGGEGGPADRLDFLRGTGAWAGGPAATGIDDIDFWIGGLAEKTLATGGLLGSTFNFVFETQLESLQSGDRFYYLARTAGLNFFVQLEESSFAELAMRSTGLEHLPFNIFSVMDYTIELSDPATFPAGLVETAADGTVTFLGDQNVVLGGTDAGDRMAGGGGDDALWGDGGSDTLSGGAGDDALVGDAGDDSLSGMAGDDVLKGGDGDDTIDPGEGDDLLLGGKGRDLLLPGADAKEAFGGQGNDTILAGDDGWAIFGNEDNDWLQGGEGDDEVVGDNNDPFGVTPIAGDDVLAGGGGDDTIRGEYGDDVILFGPGNDSMDGGRGFDWLAHAGGASGIAVDFWALDIDAVEGISGAGGDDTLAGDSFAADGLADASLIVGLSALLGDTSFTGGNIILGGGGSDFLEGRGGDDFLHGDASLSVSLTGEGTAGGIERSIRIAEAGSGAGADTLYGGAGADTLAGGDGADAFRFLLAADGGDLILDFTSGEDVIEISAWGFAVDYDGDHGLGAHRFVANADGAADAVAGAGQFVYRTTDGTLWFDADGSGAGGTVLLATLRGKPVLTIEDFSVFG